MPHPPRVGTLAQIGEFGFLAQLLPKLWRGAGVIIGPGDDCALVETRNSRFLVTTDVLIEDVHFRRGWLTPRQIGRRGFCVTASDLAAMGGRPRFVFVSVAAPPSTTVADLRRLHEGIAAAARENGASIAGGNLSRGRALFVSLTMIGDSPPRPLQRSGARPGDALYVTGDLGTAALGRQLLQGGRSGSAIQRFRQPIPRLAVGALLARRRIASAAIDVSDGLLQDLHHLCVASGVGARIDASMIPCTRPVRARGLALALSGGEDYELLYTVPPPRLASMERLKRRLGCRITRIGQILPARAGICVVDATGAPVSLRHQGFDHFAGDKRR